MSDQATTRAGRRRSRTTGPILDAAEQLFARKGLARTTVDEIAEASDVAVGSVYFHFESKDGLYLALVERALDVNERYMARVDRSLAPLERVLSAGDCYLRFFADHPAKFRLVVVRMLEPATGGTLAEAERRVAARAGRLVGAVRADLALAREEGAVRADIDVDDAMRFLWGAWNGVISLALRQDALAIDAGQLERCLALGRRMILEGLAPR
jgi:AcrR family transcriptional regulator